MTVPPENRIQHLFSQALEERDETARREFLEAQCRDDLVVRSRVERLLSAYSRAGRFLELPVTIDDFTGTFPGDDGFVVDRRPVEDVTSYGHDTDTLVETLSFLRPPKRPDDLGEFAGYDIVEFLGRGGAGIVLKARDRKLNRDVALKVLSPQWASQQRARQRFLREARAAAAVKHRHVVAIHATDEADGLPFLVMEFIQGRSLHEMIRDDGPPDEAELLRIGRQITAGLEAAHAQQLVHRDIKPANILLDEKTGDVKLTDFGLARAVDDVQITQEGMIAGTPQYMSPEQANGDPVDLRSDLYSLGSVLYTMCIGQPPFQAESTVALLRKICDESPRSVAEIRPDLNRRITSLVDDLLEKQPDRRPPSAAIVASRLAGTPVSGTSAHRRRQQRRIAITGFAAVVLLAVAVFIWGPWRAGDTESPGPDTGATQSSNAGTGSRKQTADERRTRNELFFDEDVLPLTEIRRMTVSTSTPSRRRLYGLAVSKDGNRVYASCADYTVYCWETQTGILVRRFRGTGVMSTSIAVSPNGRHLATCDADRKLRLWKTADGTIERAIPFDLSVRDASFSPDGAEIVVALAGLRAPRKPRERGLPKFLRSGRLDILDVRTGTKRRQCRPPTATSFGYVDWSPDGKRIAAGSLWGRVQLYHAADGRFVRQLTASGRPGPAYEVRFAHDGRSLYGTGSGNLLWNWSIPEGAERFSRIFNSGVVRFDVSDDGRWLAAGGASEVRLLPISKDGFGKSVLKVEGHTSPTHRVTFIPGADVLVSGGWDGTVRLWRLPAPDAARSIKQEAMPATQVIQGVDGHAADTNGDGRFDKVDTKGADLPVTFPGKTIPKEVALLEFPIPKTPGRRIVGMTLVVRVTLVNTSNRQPEIDADLHIYRGDGKITAEDATRKGTRVATIQRFTRNRLGTLRIPIDVKLSESMLEQDRQLGLRIAITNGSRMIFASRETYFKNSAPRLEIQTRAMP